MSTNNRQMTTQPKKRRRLLFDLETDNLLDSVTKIHCGVIYDLDTGEVLEYRPGNVHEIPAVLATATELWGHNIIAYDIPVLAKLYPAESQAFLEKFKGTEGKQVFDSLVMSRLIWPDIMANDTQNLAAGRIDLPDSSAKKSLIGSHSLKAWGLRLGFLKGDHLEVHGFDKFTEGMLEYCVRDVMLNAKLIESIMSKEYDPFSIWLEHQFYVYLQWQMSCGVRFDSEYANLLCFHWNKELEKRLHEMRAMVPDIIVDREFTPKVNNSKRGYKKGEPTVIRKIIPFNPRSNQHVIGFLTQKYKWKPQSFTKKKQPEITYDILRKLPYKEAPLLARIKLLMDRLKLIQRSQGGNAYLQCVKPNGRIYGRIIHNGTPTARCRHGSPNLGNIPSTSATWGRSIRRMFIPADGYILAGTDFDSLEMRCLAEVLWDYDQGAFAEMALSGSSKDGTDAHTLNMHSVKRALTEGGYPEVAANLTRHTTKTAFYAYIYGAWSRRLGLTVCEGIKVHPSKYPKIGDCVVKGFAQNIVGMTEVNEALLAQFTKCISENRWPAIDGLDGRKIPIRKKSALLNSLLQSMGAILCKFACVRLMHKLRDEVGFGEPGEAWRPVLHVHDEIQHEVREDAEGKLLARYKLLVADSFREAGEYFGFRVPILGTTSVGRSWAETH